MSIEPNSDYTSQEVQYKPDSGSGIAETGGKGTSKLSLGGTVFHKTINYTDKAKYEPHWFTADRVILSIRDDSGKTKKVRVLTSEIAQKLGISDTKVRELVDSGELEARIATKLGLSDRRMERKPVPSAAKDAQTISGPSSVPINSAILENLDKFNLTEDEFLLIHSWYQANKERLESEGTNAHLKPSETGLPRTIIYIAEGPQKGLHIKTKISVGMGSFNRASRALHVETGLTKIARSGKAEEVSERERQGNTKYSLIDPEGKHFATGAAVLHKGRWRSRQEMKKMKNIGIDPKTVPQEKEVDKVTMIMDDIPGGELFDLLVKTPPLSMFEKLTILCKLNQSLILAHKNDLVNIDYKPENVFMLDRTNPLIGDFGMAFNKGDTLTNPMGSPGYVAPEVLLADDRDTKIHPGTEMWIQGIMMSFMLKNAGFYYWTGQPDLSDLNKVSNQTILDFGVRGYFPDYKKEGSIDWCIASCLCYRPEDRITAEALQPHLESLLAKHTPQQTETETGTSSAGGAQ